MKLTCRLSLIALIVFAGSMPALPDETKDAIKETALEAPHKVKIRVRMEGPYTADVPLQVVCYFKYTPDGAKRMSGAPVELDKRLGGVIASLRERGEFAGDQQETLLIIPANGAIKAKALLLVGIGDEEALTLKVMEGVGRASLGVAAQLGVNRVAFAPLIRDQGNSKFSVGDVERAVVKGMLLAHDTDSRLQAEKLAKPFTLEEWIVDAGPPFFDETLVGFQKAIKKATSAIEKRPTDKYVKPR